MALRRCKDENFSLIVTNCVGSTRRPRVHLIFVLSKRDESKQRMTLVVRLWGRNLNAKRRDVEILYRQLLGRDPESHEAIEAKSGRPLLEVAIEVALSEEFRRRIRNTAEEDVTEIYRKLLDREPETRQAIEMKMSRPFLDVVIEVALSDEFRQKHSRSP